jgi:HSP20 family protein
MTSDEKFFESLAKGDASVHHYPVKDESDEKTPAKKSDDAAEGEGKLTIDVYQTPTDIVVESAVAGVKPDDLDIDVSTDAVTIRGERRREETIRDEDYFYQECYWGRFSRSVILPEEIDPDSATVRFKNGILTVRMPKLNKKKAKKLKVRLE